MERVPESAEQPSDLVTAKRKRLVNQVNISGIPIENLSWLSITISF